MESYILGVVIGLCVFVLYLAITLSRNMDRLESIFKKSIRPRMDTVERDKTDVGKWMRENAYLYPNLWVALKNGDVVAATGGIVDREIKQLLKAQGYQLSEVTIIKVPICADLTSVLAKACREMGAELRKKEE